MLDYLLNNWDGLIVVAFAVVGLASAVTAMTPSKEDDALVAKIKGILDVLALNIGHAKK